MREVSIRKLLKIPNLPAHYRRDLQAELNHLKYQRKYKTEHCPICGEELYRNSWYEDHWGQVESVVQCGSSYDRTHFMDHFSYGYTDLIAGDFESSYNHKTPDDEVERLRAEWLLAAKSYKERCKKNRKLAYRKSRSQQRRKRA